MARYRYKIVKVVSSRILRILFERLEDEDRPFAATARKTHPGIWRITIKTHLLNLQHFENMFNRLSHAW